MRICNTFCNIYGAGIHYKFTSGVLLNRYEQFVYIFINMNKDMLKKIKLTGVFHYHK